LVVAGGEGGDVEVEELVGEGVAHGDAPQQRPDAADTLLVETPLPDRRLTLLDMDLVERERPEPHVPVAALPETLDQGLVGVAGERAAVIPGKGELTSHGASRRTTTCTTTGHNLSRSTPHSRREPSAAPAGPAGRSGGRAG